MSAVGRKSKLFLSAGTSWISTFSEPLPLEPLPPELLPPEPLPEPPPVPVPLPLEPLPPEVFPQSYYQNHFLHPFLFRFLLSQNRNLFQNHCRNFHFRFLLLFRHCRNRHCLAFRWLDHFFLQPRLVFLHNFGAYWKSTLNCLMDNNR